MDNKRGGWIKVSEWPRLQMDGLISEWRDECIDKCMNGQT